MTAWYYVRGAERLGPVDVNEMRALAARGELSVDDLVWTDGMAEWVPARTRGEFGFDSVAAQPPPARVAVAPTAPVASTQFPAQPVGYYFPTGGMPPRAARSTCVGTPGRLVMSATGRSTTRGWRCSSRR
jgi:hypothetical protein